MMPPCQRPTSLRPSPAPSNPAPPRRPGTAHPGRVPSGSGSGTAHPVGQWHPVTLVTPVTNPRFSCPQHETQKTGGLCPSGSVDHPKRPGKPGQTGENRGNRAPSGSGKGAHGGAVTIGPFAHRRRSIDYFSKSTFFCSFVNTGSLDVFTPQISTLLTSIEKPPGNNLMSVTLLP